VAAADDRLGQMAQVRPAHRALLDARFDMLSGSLFALLLPE
jgi:hypothetical protein